LKSEDGTLSAAIRDRRELTRKMKEAGSWKSEDGRWGWKLEDG